MTTLAQDPVLGVSDRNGSQLRLAPDRPVYRKARAGYVGEVEKIGDMFVAAVFGPDLWVQDLGAHPTSLHAIAIVDGALADFAELDMEATA